ncbi:MAG: hypothetical protein CL780_03555 [Chloroflexi bacterium]|nr:hypothetical protein [Chloroflexota bacterium]|tara:strand:- start:3131 stop:3811 length:681 start_codon:yes stop_codon:yes gene_type:complete
MAKLNTFEFPDYSLLDSFKLGSIINSHFNGSVSRNTLSRSLNMSPFGGAFASKLAAARMWGIIIGRGNIELTEHAKTVINLHSLDFNSYKKLNFFLKIPFFNEIITRTKLNILNKEILGPIVQDITNVEPFIIKKKLPSLVKVYNSTYSNISVNYLLSEINTKHITGNKISKIDNFIHQSNTNDDYQLTSKEVKLSFPGVSINLPINSKNLQSCIYLLENYIDSLK